MTDTVQTEAVSGVEIFVPLNKLKKSPKNARKVPHGEAAIEALAASIAHKGLIQNLVVEPEIADGQPTGCYLVTAGEGRRLALLLRAKRRQIKKAHPVRCWLDTENDPAEISLDENVTRTAMHPADQFERFRELSENRGWGAEEIGARFGVSAQVVKQRLRLGAVSPKLLDIYRQGGVTLDQLQAFAITEDHDRQEQVFANLAYNKEPWIIRRDLTADKVPATDRRALFVGTDAYVEAGGALLRDLFTEDGGGFLEDAALLDTLVIEKLREIAADVEAEGWKWTLCQIDYPYDHGMRRHFPQPVELADAEEARLAEAAAAHDALTEGYSDYDEMPEAEAAEAQALLAEIEAIERKRTAYDPEIVARGGAFVTLGANGEPRIERGFVRPEDEPQPEPEAEDESGLSGTPEAAERDAEPDDAEDAGETGKPLSDSLIRDLTAYRTLGLRVALGARPDLAMVALTHALAARLFYCTDATCLEIGVSSEALGGHADGIADSVASEALATRHDQWAEQMPRNPADLWGYVAGLADDSRAELLAHCVSLSVNAVKVPWDRRTWPLEAADRLAEALDLDMTGYWTPTARSYFGRVTKAQIAEAVTDAVSPEAAERIMPLKKGDMAEAAEQLLVGTGWLPPVLRTRSATTEDAVDVEAEAAVIAEPVAEAEGIAPQQAEPVQPSDSDGEGDRYAVAAE